MTDPAAKSKYAPICICLASLMVRPPRTAPPQMRPTPGTKAGIVRMDVVGVDVVRARLAALACP